MSWLHEMKWPEVSEYLKVKDTILIPVGSTEQHGRHAPLGTDSFVAIRLAEEAASKADVISAPPLFFGWSPHHMVLPGTISIEPAVLVSLVCEEIKSLSVHGFKNFVIINGHRITNVPWMQIAAARAQSECDVRVVVFDPAYMSKEVASELGVGWCYHADEAETSHMLYIRPDLINMNEATDSDVQPTHLCNVDPRCVEDSLCYVPSTVAQMKKAADETGGCTGQPSKSTVDTGKRYHEHLVQRLVEVVEMLQKGTE